MVRSSRLIWIAALAGAALARVDAATPPLPEPQPMHFEHLTMREGLSQSTVMSILQDSRGYLWLATENGLDRYDGYAIREYRRERGNPHGLASDYVWKIAEDSQGDLWLATIGGGVARWDRKGDRFEQFRHDPTNPQTLASDEVRTLLIDADGRIWIATLAQGLDVLDPRTRRVQHFRHDANDPGTLPSDTVFALHRDYEGGIWVGTDGGLVRHEPTTNRFVRYGADAAKLSSQRIRALREDHTGALWVGTVDGGLNRLDRKTGQVTAYRNDAGESNSLSNDRVLAIFEDDAQRLWVGTPKGLNLYDRKHGRFLRYTRDPDNPHSLRDDDIMSLYQDHGGVLWVGTRGGGASHWNPNGWALGHYRSELIRNTPVNSFADNGAGKVWVGTVNGLVEIDMATRHERHYTSAAQPPLQLADNRVMALLYDRAGALWIGTMSGGLQRNDPDRGVVRSYRHSETDAASLPADGIMTLHQDRSGQIWVGTFGGGIASIDPATGALTRYPYGEAQGAQLSSPRVSAIADDLQGNLWIGTIAGGLNLLERRTGRFYTYRRNDADPSTVSDDTIFSLHVDGRGDVWVGTAGGGVDRVIGSSQNPSSVRFESQSSLQDMPSQVVYGIESDAAGRLWLSTNNGLARFDPRERSVKLFHEMHGLQADEFNFNAHYRGRDGTLYFGGNNGFNVFLPEAVQSQAPAPRIALTSVAIPSRTGATGELPGPGRPLVLDYRDKLVAFEFAALDFTSPASNRYRYRLDGFEHDWVDAGARRQAAYTNLDAGEYTFRVRGANADGVWGDTELAIPVRVAAAPWNTLLARVLYACVALVVLGYLWRLQQLRRGRELRYSRELERMVHVRTSELEERNAELQVLTRAKGDFVARMSHELRTPMNGVLGMSELLLDTRLDATQQRFVEGIHRSADSLLAIVDDVLDFSKIEAGRLQLNAAECDLIELVEQTAEMLAARAAAKGIELLCDCPALPLPRVHVDAVRLRQVLVNLGGNAVKFTDRGAVVLRLTLLGGEGAAVHVRIQVADTGLGIAPENQSQIFEEFSQADASTTRRFGGTGLGLAIARQIVDLMGGRLTVVSAPAAGSTFSFELSLRPADAVPPAVSVSGLEGMSVLVAQGNATARAITVDALAKWGARALGVDTLEGALREMRATAYNAIVIEDDLLATAATALQDALAQCPMRPRVVRLANFASMTSDAAVDRQWIDAYVTKPVRLARLCRAVSTGIEDAGRSPDAAISRMGTLPLLQGRVLLVEDQPLNRDVASGLLKSIGLEVHAAADGQQALEKLAAARYDLVLMDCQMPAMDGFEATAEWRRREPEGSHVPIIALTADVTSEGRWACAAAGMDDFLGKPFNRANLHAVLRPWLTPRTQDDRPQETASAS